MNNFASFYTQSIKDKIRKIKKGKYKGQRGIIKHRNLTIPGQTYYQQPGKSDAPSASTYTVRG